MIIQAEKSHIEDMTRLVSVLWNEDRDILEAEITKNICRNDTVYFIKMADGNPVAFAQCQLRYDYVEGTDSSPVGYLEGIFVKEKWRLNHIAADLVRECEQWAKGRGCTEFASDCELDNTISHEFHLKSGFEEMNRIICFRKSI